jgi:hypothetical protein
LQFHFLVLKIECKLASLHAGKFVLFPTGRIFLPKGKPLKKIFEWLVFTICMPEQLNERPGFPNGEAFSTARCLRNYSRGKCLPLSKENH